MYRLNNFKKLGNNEEGHPTAEFEFLGEKFTFYCKEDSPLLMRLYDSGGELLQFSDDELFQMTGLNCPFFLTEAICDILNLNYEKYFYHGYCFVQDRFTGVDETEYITISYSGSNRFEKIDDGGKKVYSFEPVIFKEIIQLPKEYEDVFIIGSKVDMRLLYGYVVIVRCYGSNGNPIHRVKKRIKTNNFINNGYKIDQSLSKRSIRSIKARLSKKSRNRKKLDHKDKKQRYKKSSSRSNPRKINRHTKKDS